MTPTNNRELSWLAFNDRVLQEACDPTVPLMQRLRFLGIFSSNQDEFIKVRLAGLIRLAHSRVKSGRRLSGGYLPQDLLALISAKINRNLRLFDQVFQDLLQEMEDQGIRVVNETQLSPEQTLFCRNYFTTVLSVRLVPLMITKSAPLPLLHDDHIYLGVKMEKGRQASYAIIRIPVAGDCPRFVEVPFAPGRRDLIFIDDIIRLCLDDVFFMFSYDRLSAHTFKIMRDAQLVLDEDVTTSLITKMEKGLASRLQGSPVRLTCDQEMPADLLELLLRKLKMRRDQMVTSTRYHMMRDLMRFPRVGGPELEEPEIPPLAHPDLPPRSSLLTAIRRRDVLLHFPYHTFNHLVDFLREAAIDPKVSDLFITLYRTAEHSKIINALANAARNGKNVVAVVELLARFDEEQNMESVETLQRAGVKVLHGLRDLKVHGKLILVERREPGGPRGYLFAGTGNFNEATARAYSDLGLFTADPALVADARAIFDFLLTAHGPLRSRRLLVSPFSLRQQLTRLIRREIKNARAGRPAHIHIKCNTLTDEEMVRLLYEAGRAGVEVRLIVRGACCLMPQVVNLSENIQAVSIVDKFLEHSRLYIFAAGGQERMYISSADLMTRNLDRRLEVAAPILAEGPRRMLRAFFDLQWSDNVKARDLAELGGNTYVSTGLPRRVRSQTALYQHYRHESEDAP